jgi:hypothetical protein
MVAKGLAPLAPTDLVLAIYQLACDADPAIAEAARATSRSLPEKALATALASPLHPVVLDFFAERLRDQPRAIERILLNRRTADETLVALARALKGRELAILAGNEQRILRVPAIIEALYFNTEAPMSTVHRLLEMAVRNGIDLPRIPEFKSIAESILGTGASKETGTISGPALDQVFAEVIADGDIAEAPTAPGDVQGAAEEKGEETEEETEKKVKNIALLPISAKVRLATIGTAYHRSILIKDSNRTVALAAITSPAVSENEVRRYASNRSLQEEIIRYIAQKKDWQKSYPIKVALVNNPKCPLSQSMGLLKHLRPADLKGVANSKGVPSPLVQAAKQMLKSRL